MKKKDIKKVEKAVENAGLGFDFKDDVITISFQGGVGDETKPYGGINEDYTIETDDVKNKTYDDLVDEVYNVMDDYDYEEHAKFWVNAKKEGAQGVPRIGRLVDEARAIGELLEILWRELGDAA